MDVWTFNWLFWLAGFFLSYELYAALTHQRTLSEQTWNWFSLGQRKAWWGLRRGVFVVFWLLLGGHFVFQLPALWSVILPAVPFGAVIVLSTFVWRDAASAPVPEERSDPMSFLKKVWGGLKRGGWWVLRRGPLWSALLVGASTVLPGIAPILKALASGIAGASGGAVDQGTVEVFSQIISGALLLIGALRKFWAIASAKPV